MKDVRGAHAFAIAIGFEGGPEPFSRFRPGCSKIPIAVGAVEVIALGQGVPKTLSKLVSFVPFQANLAPGWTEKAGHAHGYGHLDAAEAANGSS